MAIVISEVEVEALETPDRQQQSPPAPRGRQKLDANELAALLKKQDERMQRLWAD